MFEKTSWDLSDGTLPAAKTDPRAAWICCLILWAIGYAVRMAHLANQAVSAFDPWRHMALMRNIRAGEGFSLFDGQPYIWYNPVWYYLASIFLPEDSIWFAAVVASLIPPLLFWLCFRLTSSFWVSVSVGLMAAVFGPMVAYTCTMGGESFSLLCLFSGILACTWRESRRGALLGGLLVGLALATRINLLYNGFFLIPLLWPRRDRILLFAGAAALIVGGFWLRNIWVIHHYDFLFTWDGMASGREGYGLLSSLIPPLHSDVKEATRELYLALKPHLGWIQDHQGYRWGAIAFMVTGMLTPLLIRNVWLILTVGLTMIHFSFLDSSLSTNFFRHYIAVFPAMFLSIALCGQWVMSRRKTSRKAIQVVLVLLALIVGGTGVRYLKPQGIAPLRFWTLPPAAFEDAEHILINSGMFQPESFVYRYPDRSFVGLPYRAEDVDAFLEAYPAYRTVLWRELYSVQDPVLKALRDTGRLQLEKRFVSREGIRYRRYRILDPTHAAEPKADTDSGD